MVEIAGINDIYERIEYLREENNRLASLRDIPSKADVGRVLCKQSVASAERKVNEIEKRI